MFSYYDGLSIDWEYEEQVERIMVNGNMNFESATNDYVVDSCYV